MATMNIAVELSQEVADRLRQVLAGNGVTIEEVIEAMAIEIAQAGELPRGFRRPSTTLKDAMGDALGESE